MMLSTKLSTVVPRPGWLLVGGCLLAALGLARPSLGPLSHPVQGGPGGQEPPDPPTQTFPIAMGSATADSNNRMIAVTGIDVTGASILYLVDTQSQRLAVYQASGGAEKMQGIKLVGARRIDLDFELDGYNDRSAFTYKQLLKTFVDQGLLPDPSAAAGAPAGAKQE